MKCMDCQLKYVGQTGRTFYTRHKEHIKAIKIKLTQGIRTTYWVQDTYGSITDTLENGEVERKGKHLNTLEKYHVYRFIRNRLHMNNTHIDTYNPIFEALQEVDTRKWHAHNIRDSVLLSIYLWSTQTLTGEDTQQDKVSTQIILQNSNIHCIQNTNTVSNACYTNTNGSWGFTSYIRRTKQAQQSP
jgi:uncharacterized protein YbcV (DUF1398 family)